MLRKRIIDPSDVPEQDFDLLLSGYNTSDRVQYFFSNVRAHRRIWLVQAEYGFDPRTLPSSEEVWHGDGELSELEFWLDLFETVFNGDAKPAGHVCIDITGLMRPHIIALPLALALVGAEKITIAYSDPTAYAAGIDTKFSIGAVDRVAQIPGFEGVHGTAAEPYDALIVGAGYDDGLIRAVAEFKRSAEHFILLGLPSLQPHMYQESQVRLHLARESIHNYRDQSFLYSPASDPFVTAQVLSDHAESLRRKRPEANIYLAPVGPKAHVLGFALFFLCEEMERPTSIIFPFAPRYHPETSRGIARVHLFDLELDWIPLGRGVD